MLEYISLWQEICRKNTIIWPFWLIIPFETQILGKNIFSYLPNWPFTANSHILNCSSVRFQENEHSKISQEETSEENHRNKNDLQRVREDWTGTELFIIPFAVFLTS